MSDWQQYLSSLYFDFKSPASFGGPEKLYQHIKDEGKYKIGRHRIRRWLQNQESYSLTWGARRRFKRSRVIVNGINSQWDMDLMDMANLQKHNEGVKYILIVIDVFSRFLYAQPVKSKRGADVVMALKRILTGPKKPNTIRTDRGMEFRSKEVNKYLYSQSKHHMYAYNTETKANYAKRVIKTLKHKICRYLLKNRTSRYIDILQDFVHSYNHTHHRSLGENPAAISVKNEGESRLQQYLIRTKGSKGEKPVIKKFKYKIGQTVRLLHIRSVFDREYSQKWTGEIFKIRSRFKRQGLPIYTLVDWDNDEIDGTFYEQELQAINIDDGTDFSIEKILKRRTRNKKQEVLVRWLHWPKKYDRWIPETDITQYS